MTRHFVEIRCPATAELERKGFRQAQRTTSKLARGWPGAGGPGAATGGVVFKLAWGWPGGSLGARGPINRERRVLISASCLGNWICSPTEMLWEPCYDRLAPWKLDLLALGIGCARPAGGRVGVGPVL